MKIFYLIKSLSGSGGMERVVTLKANMLSDIYSLNIEIITYSDDLGVYFDLSDKVKIKNFPLKGSSQKNIFKEIASYISAANPDVLISTGGKDMALAGKVNKNIYKVLEPPLNKTRTDFARALFLEYCLVGFQILLKSN